MATNVAVHTCHQFGGAEGFGHVVVGAGVQGVNLHRLLTNGGQHENRDAIPGSQALANLDAVEVRQQQVQNHEVEVLGEAFQGGLPVRDTAHAKPVRPKDHSERSTDRVVVVEDLSLLMLVPRLGR